MLRKLMMCVCMLLCVPADAAEWLTDIPTAQQRAAEEGKKVLVVFTGTDWCLWCIHLKNQIFTTPAFREFAKEQLVPVEIDIPRNRALVGGEENYKKNRAACRQYGITGYPTVIVMTPDGDVLGGYSGGYENWEHARRPIEGALARAGELAAIRRQSGAARLRSLEEFYDSLPERVKPCARRMREEIERLRAECTAGK